jgi:hypothetical protein
MQITATARRERRPKSDERLRWTSDENTPVNLPRPDRQAALERHNARMGSAVQRFIHVALFLCVVAPPLAILLRLFFRCELRGAQHFARCRERGAIFAVRHYYEWDPFIPKVLALWPLALRYPHFSSMALGGAYWTRTPLRRFASYCLGILGLQRGQGLQQSAIDRFAALSARRPSCISIFPTGPIGKRDTYRVGPGVAQLALKCPDVPVLPVTLLGVADLRLRDVFLGRRPRITLSIGAPFTAGEVQRDTDVERILVICRRIAAQWAREEDAARDRHPAGSGSVHETVIDPSLAL